MFRRQFFLLCSGVLWALSFVPVASGQGLSPEDATRRMTVANGLEVQLVASEPQVLQPIFVKFDDRGRLWTIQYLQYPNPEGLKRVKVDRWSRTIYDRVPEPPPRGPRGADKISLLMDDNGDGRTDRVQDVITGLNLCTGLEFGHGGLYVLQVPYLLFYPDQNRDDIPDADPQVLLEGFGMEDAQSFANHLTWGPDGWLYGVNGSTTTCRIRGLEFQQGVWRYHPLTKEFELFCEGGGNTFGLTFDAEGQLIYTNNGGYLAFHALQGAYYQKSFGKHGPLHNPYAYGYFSDIKKEGSVPGAPSTGGTIYLAKTFPAEYRGALISGNFLGHSISWWKLSPIGATFSAKHAGLLLNSNDPWCGPTDLCLGPDGNVYWSDFYDQRTAHPDPDANWDRSNGRIYRILPKAIASNVSSADSPVAVDLANLVPEQLVKVGQETGWHGDRARVLLSGLSLPDVKTSLVQQIRNETDPSRLLRLLWMLHGQQDYGNRAGWLDDNIGISLLSHASPAIRAWTVRLIGDVRQTTARLSARLIELAAEEQHPVVLCQLASSARRLPETGFAIVKNLLEQHPDEADPYYSLMLWWALEPLALTQDAQVIALFPADAVAQHEAYRFQLRKLLRRYAAAGTRRGYDLCAQLWIQSSAGSVSSTTSGGDAASEQAVWQGLSERGQVLADPGQGGLLEQFVALEKVPEPKSPPVLPVAGALRDLILRKFEVPGHTSTMTRLALIVDYSHVSPVVLKTLAEPQSEATQRELLTLLTDYADAECIDSVLPFIERKGTAELRIQAIRLLARFDDPRITATALQVYGMVSEKERHAIRELCFRRVSSSLALLQEVEAGRIPPQDVPLEQLRLAALHRHDEVNRLLRKYWGNLQPGTNEEKLATVRRFNNDLRAGTGDPAKGKLLFTKQCAICHKLNNEGGQVGPDLTAANRGDRDFLLISIVDPSSVVRSQYLNYVATTISGGVLQGVIGEQDAASVTLIDAKGEKHKLQRSDIDEFVESSVSLMPEKLLENLNPQELRDLFAYLQSRQ